MTVSWTLPGLRHSFGPLQTCTKHLEGMDVDAIEFLPALKCVELKNKVIQTTVTEKAKFTNVERSEALESLGVVQFFNGDFAEAVQSLEGSIGPRFIKLKSKKRLVMIKMLVSLNYCSLSALGHKTLIFPSPSVTV